MDWNRSDDDSGAVNWGLRYMSLVAEADCTSAAVAETEHRNRAHGGTHPNESDTVSIDSKGPIHVHS